MPSVRDLSPAANKASQGAVFGYRDNEKNFESTTKAAGESKAVVEGYKIIIKSGDQGECDRDKFSYLIALT